MGYACVVSEREADVVRKLWPEPKADDPKIEGILFHFSPKTARANVETLYESAEDANIVRRLVERIARIMGPAFLKAPPKPVATEPEAAHIEDSTEDTATEETQDEPSGLFGSLGKRRSS